MKKRFLTIFILLSALFIILPSCKKDGPEGGEEITDNDEMYQRYYVNMFAFNIMATYYLWYDEMASEIKDWKQYGDPYEKLESVLYRDSSGNLVDKWTQLTDDYSGFTATVSGNGLTYGGNYKFYYANSEHTKVCAVVTYVYADSPAGKAGLKRGDAILKINGKEMTPDNYYEIASEGLFSSSSVTLGLSDGNSVSMTAVDMYENPVQTVRVFEAGSRKAGYLHFSAFTADACEDLISTFKDFKSEGITDLILDLRYNGGGYAMTAEVLASMIAPPSAVAAGEVFMTEVFNTRMSAYEEDNKTRFTTDFDFTIGGKSHKLSTEDANPDIGRIYVLTSSGSASASESLVCGLLPYCDITLIGGKTHGKFCSGLIISAKSWYDAVRDQLKAEEYNNGVDATDNWGIYVMYSRFADKNGVTVCMPDGITPDIEVEDNPFDGYQLGDREETLLAKALSYIDDSGSKAAVTKSAPVRQALPDILRPGWGVLLREAPELEATESALR